MKILYVLNSGRFGGMEWHVYDLVKGMIEKGHEVHVWCKKGELSTKYKELGAKVKNKSIPIKICPSYILALSSYLKENKIDVMHAHELKAVINSLVAAHIAKTKVRITNTHTPISEWKVGNFKKKIDILVNSLVVNKFASTEIALTESRKLVKQKEGIKESKLVVIPNSFKSYEFDITQVQKIEYKEEIKKRYNLGPEDFIFGYVARLTPEKGHAVLIEGFKKFLEYDLFHKKNFYLLLAGGGVLEKELKELVNKYDLESNVIFTGRFEQEDLVKYYSSFDAFVFPSLAEGFGLVLLEAMYAQVPILCSDLPVLKEVAEDTVDYFRAGDVDDLADRMTRLYKNIVSTELSKIESARERVETLYTLKKFIQNYEDLYLRLLR